MCDCGPNARAPNQIDARNRRHAPQIKIGLKNTRYVYQNYDTDAAKRQ